LYLALFLDSGFHGFGCPGVVFSLHIVFTS
jgi:hypothetical protein